MSRDLYLKLVDLYAARELPLELAEQMEWASFGDAQLSHEMSTLRLTVDVLRESPQPDYTEEIHQRILNKIRLKGAEIETTTPEPSHLQLYLPITG